MKHSQFRSGGHAGVSVGRSRLCGHTGRFVHVWISLISPRTPACTHSTTRRMPPPAWPWLPICVATFFFLVASASVRASQIECVSGFSQ